jgi:ubiquinone/menaquinone biosynthesis C-methylase UbiE
VSRYEVIGRTYSTTRRADPRVAVRIRGGIGSARRVVNVGAGTGNYEPVDLDVVALDPSPTMRRQRPPPAAPAVLGGAEHLPFADDAFDVALAILTLHHWHDVAQGLREMQRVARRQVIFFFDVGCTNDLWLIDDYFPQIVDLETERRAPDATKIANVLHVRHIEAVPIPADCTDGFAGAYWNRPEAYLDPGVQAGMSCCALLDPESVAQGTERLRRDLESGVWDERHGELRSMTEIDLGYRLLLAERRA